MSKKGFTLVELIGVIVILGLLVVIVTPNIIKTLTKQKDKLYSQQIVILEESAEKWTADNNSKISQNGDIYLLSLEKIIEGGYIKDNDLIDPRDNSKLTGCVVIKWSSASSSYKYNYEKNCQMVQEPPISCFKYNKVNDNNIDIIGYTCGDSKDYIEYNSYSSFSTYTNIIIPTEIDGIPVTSISSFNAPASDGKYHNGIKYLVIPNTIKVIGEKAFYNNELSNVFFAEGINSIGPYSFYSNKISSINIPNSVTIIGIAGFRSNSAEKVVLGSGLTEVSESSFENNSNLTELTLGRNISTIGKNAFKSCGLKSIVIPDNVITIREAAFYKNPLESVELPSSVMNLETNAFYYGDYGNEISKVVIHGKSSTSNFTTYGSNVFYWKSGSSDSNIIWD